MDAEKALKIAADRFNWGEDISTEIYALIKADLEQLTQDAYDDLRDLIEEIAPGAIDKYGFKPKWESSNGRLRSIAYSLPLPSYEDTSAALELTEISVDRVSISIVVRDDRGTSLDSIPIADLDEGAIESTIAEWVADLQQVAYYKQNNKVCLSAICNVLAGNGYPVLWQEGLELKIYEWTVPGIDFRPLFCLGIGSIESYPFPSIEVITLDGQTYYLPTSSVCREHVVASIEDLRLVSLSLVDRFKQSIDGFIETHPKLWYSAAIDRAIFKVDSQFSLDYEFYCPIPEIAAIACINYLA